MQDGIMSKGNNNGEKVKFHLIIYDDLSILLFLVFT
jgi:hypothetical protein